MSVLLAVKRVDVGFNSLMLAANGLISIPLLLMLTRTFARASHSNPAIIKSRVGKVIGKSKVTVGHEPVFSVCSQLLEAF